MKSTGAFLCFVCGNLHNRIWPCESPALDGMGEFQATTRAGNFSELGHGYREIRYRFQKAPPHKERYGAFAAY